MALKQQLIKPARPVQTVTPEPVKPLQSLPQTVKSGRILRKANTMPKVNLLSYEWYFKNYICYFYYSLQIFNVTYKFSTYFYLRWR